MRAEIAGPLGRREHLSAIFFDEAARSLAHSVPDCGYLGRFRFRSLGDDLPEPGRDGRAKVVPKYRNPEPPHQTWSGRGRMAKWGKEEVEAGARLEDFAIEDGGHVKRFCRWRRWR